MATIDHSSIAEASNTNGTSQGLLVRAGSKDQAAWERLVKLYSPMVYFWCQQSGLPVSDLHDVYQDVFYALARNIHQFRPIQDGTFRGWLRTLTRNKLNDHFRRAGREPRGLGGSDAWQLLENVPASTHQLSSADFGNENRNGGCIQSESEIEQLVLREALANVRRNFSEQTWKAFWMVVIDGRDTNQVATDLRMRPGTVRVAKSRVLKRLRLELGDFVK